VHDARIVATMKAHGIKNLLTFNSDDFKRYTEITVHHPQGLAI
jgi:predicted nucleic acid-binding protein